MLHKPPRLRPGDLVATVSLSWGGPGTFGHRYDAGVRQLEAEFGVHVVEMPHVRRDAAWLHSHPEARADDLMCAFADPSIAAIFATIGGDDSIRLLPHIDFATIARHPKIFMGYSDTTVTHLACLKAGLGTFYGPSIMAGFAENNGMFPYMVDAVHRTLFQPGPAGEIAPNSAGWTVEMLDWSDPAKEQRSRRLEPTTGWRWLQGTGVHEGHLIGGCLEVLDWLRGTAVWPDAAMWRGAILFVETSEEAPTPETVLRIMRSFAAVGVFADLAGILVGRPGGGIPPERWHEYDTAIRAVVADEQGHEDIPIVTGMDFGHTDPMFVLPYGVRARIDCDQQRFSIIEEATTDH